MGARARVCPSFGTNYPQNMHILFKRESLFIAQLLCYN